MSFWAGQFSSSFINLSRAVFIKFHFGPGNGSSILGRAIFINFHFGPGNFYHVSSILGRVTFHQVSSILARQCSSTFVNCRPGNFHQVSLWAVQFSSSFISFKSGQISSSFFFGRAIFIKLHQFKPGIFHQVSFRAGHVSSSFINFRPGNSHEVFILGQAIFSKFPQF